MAEKKSGFGNTKNDKANLPQEVIIKNYPELSYGGDEPDLGDSQQGIDEQIRGDVNGLRKHRSKRKY